MNRFKLISILIAIVLIGGSGIVSMVIKNNRNIDEIKKMTIQIQPSLKPYSMVIIITSDRKMVYQEFEWGYDYFNDPEINPISTTERILSEKEYDELIKTVINNSFMALPKEINNFNVYDGQSIYIEVQTNNTSHLVGGYMPQTTNENFQNIYKQIMDL